MIPLFNVLMPVSIVLPVITFLLTNKIQWSILKISTDITNKYVVADLPCYRLAITFRVY